MTRYWRRYGFPLAITSSVLVGGAIAVSGDCALAQITPDGTLPNNSIVTPLGNTSLIEGGTRAGSNLFHSFEQFSIPNGGAAHFNNALDIQNIISRVTGKSISNIDGLIRANGTANLFLLNPNSIIFGPNASLNIGGSFLASTASSLNFADGSTFSATAPKNTPLLSVSVPIGLQYGGSAGSIVNQSQATNSSGEVVGLQVLPGKTLGLVGGNVSLDGGSLNAQGGRVEIAGVAGPGAVGFFVDGNGLRLSFPDVVARANVYFDNRAEANVRAAGGGSIAINAQNLNLTQGSRLEAGIASGLGNSDTKAGDIEINSTGNVSFDGEGSGAYNQVESNAIGNAGNINVTAVSLSVTKGGKLNTSTEGQGNAGNVNVNARDTVSFVGEGPNNISSRVYSRVEEEGVGQAGDIYIKTGSLSVSDGAYLSASTSGIGDAGDVTIDARDTVRFDGAGPAADDFFPSVAYAGVNITARGQGGNVNITTGSLEVTGGAFLSAGTVGIGDAGNVIINARDQVSFDGVGTNGISSGAYGQPLFRNTPGQGGNIIITTGSLSVTKGASLSSSTYGKGNAGSVNIKARELVSFDGVGTNGVHSGASSRVEKDAGGNGGSVNITTGSLSVTNGANLIVSSFGQGVAGDLIINARSTVRLDNQSRIGATTIASGNGGDITVRSQDLLLLRNNSNISTTAGTAGAGGNGGNITIDSPFIVAVPSENSDITANAFTGRGGKIQITAQGIFGTQFREDETRQSDITASSKLGRQGEVKINTPDVDPSQGLATLPTELIEASGLITSTCAAVGENKFTITGRGGLPPSPNEVLSSDAVWVDWGTLNPKAENSSSPPVSTNQTETEPAAIVEARGWVINGKGEVMLTANAPTTTPHNPWITSATCHTPQASS